jgi:Ca2+-binding EF-hand superfamily protein
LFDEDGSGSIEVSEIETKLKDMGFGNDVGAALRRVLSNADADGSTRISLAEFKKLMSKKMVRNVSRR